MELASDPRGGQPGGLTMAGIPFVFTIARVAKMLGDLDSSKPVVVHCKGGYRSAIACSLIQRAGFENVTNLIGGLDAWQAMGLAVSA